MRREISLTDAAFQHIVSDLGREERGDWRDFRARKQHMLVTARVFPMQVHKFEANIGLF